MTSVPRRSFGQSGIYLPHLAEVLLLLMISVSCLLNSHVSALKATTRPHSSTIGPTTRPTPRSDLRYTTAPFYSVFTCPNPQIKDRQCRPKDPHKSYFCDPNSILSMADASGIDTMLRQIRTGKTCTCEAKTPCLVGTVVTVVVLPEVLFMTNLGTDTHKQLRYFSDELRQKWRLGSCGDDIFLVVSNIHKSASLSVGDPLKVQINDTEVARIETMAGDIKNLKPVLKEISRLLGVQLRDPASAQVQSTGLSTWTIVAVVALIIGFIIVVALAATIGSYCGRKCNNGQSKLETAEVRAYSDPERPPVNKQRRSRNILRSKRTNEERPEGNKRRAWFGRIRRNDRGKESTRGSSTQSNNMYTEPEETRESHYNDSRGSRNSGAYDNNKRNSSKSDRPDHYENSRDSAGSYGDRRSGERNSGSAYGESRLEF